VVLVGRAADAVRAGTAAKGVELFEPLENPHGGTISGTCLYSPNGLKGFAPVPTSTLFDSR
jgi:hypothetical protein